MPVDTNPFYLFRLFSPAVNSHAHDLTPVWLYCKALGAHQVRHRNATIVREVLNGDTLAVSAARHGVHRSTVRDIVLRFTRSTIPSLPVCSNSLAVARSYRGWLLRALTAHAARNYLY